MPAISHIPALPPGTLGPRKVGLRPAQFDCGGVHQHVHDEVEPYGQCAEQEPCDIHVLDEDVEQRQQGHYTALYKEDVFLDAVLVGLRERLGSSPSRAVRQSAARPRYPREDAGERSECDEQRDDVGHSSRCGSGRIRNGNSP